MTRSLARKLFLPLVLVTSLVCPTAAVFAQEVVGEVGAELAEKAGERAQHAANTFKSALAGDQQAMLQLATQYLLPAAIALLTLIIGYMIASFIGRVVGIAVARKVDLTLGKFLSKMVKNTIMLLVFLGALGFFGVDVTSFAAILAAGGFAIGMALQGTLSNFAAGVMLLVFRPFKVGDYIKLADTEGTVDEIDLFTTRLNSLDNRHLILPNNSVFGSAIENVSHNEFRRADVDVGVSYDADLAMTRRVLEQAISRVAGAVAHPPPQVYLVDLGDSAVNWQVRVWCRPDVYWEVRERAVAASKQALDAAGISIPYPQLDLHLVGNTLAAAESPRLEAA